MLSRLKFISNVCFVYMTVLLAQQAFCDEKVVPIPAPTTIPAVDAVPAPPPPPEALPAPSTEVAPSGQPSKTSEDTDDETPATGSAKEKEETKTDADKEAPEEQPSWLSEKLSQRMMVTTSFGFVSVFQKSNNWRANGASDLSASFISTTPLWAQNKPYLLLRYLPMEVSPVYGSGTGTQEYLGVLNTFTLGVGLAIKVAKGVKVLPTIELASHKAYLKEQLFSHASDTPTTSGMSMIFGAELRARIIKNFFVGPRINLGVGTFKTTQISVNVAFLL